MTEILKKLATWLRGRSAAKPAPAPLDEFY